MFDGDLQSSSHWSSAGRGVCIHFIARHKREIRHAPNIVLGPARSIDLSNSFDFLGPRGSARLKLGGPRPRR